MDCSGAKMILLDHMALIQEGNSSFNMNDVSPTMKMISHRFFYTLPAAIENNKYKQLCRSFLLIIIIMTSYAPISSKIELSGKINQGNKQARNRRTMRESSTDG